MRGGHLRGGLARLPSLVCGEAVRDGRLRVLFGADATRLRPIHAVYPSRQYLPAKVRLFLDALTRLTLPLRPLPPRARGGRGPADLGGPAGFRAG